MSDSVKLTPALPVVPPLPPQPAVRPDVRVEPAEKTRPESRTADNGNARPREEQERLKSTTERNLTISHQEKMGGFIYRSVDVDSGEVVWQYPAESSLRMSQTLRDMERAAARHEGRKADELA
jgi:uncharacterized FlaG/YvyC family protein